MAAATHVFDFLDSPATTPPGMCVLFGDASFLKRLALDALKSAILGDDDDPMFAVFDGDEAEWRDVRDELTTVSLFGDGARLAIVENADTFVTANRDKLEDYAKEPSDAGVLILNVKKWPANTRLYKQLAKTGLQIACKPPERKGSRNNDPDLPRIRQWIVTHAKRVHQLNLDDKSCEVLLDLTGVEFGILDQNIAKLALFADEQGNGITPQVVADVVGGWRTKTSWDLIAAALDGDSAEALLQLDRLTAAGEKPIALFGAIAWSLRRFADAVRYFERAEQRGKKITLSSALQQAGVSSYRKDALSRAESQLKQLGRNRAKLFHAKLIEMDLALKGSHSTDARGRFLLESLFLMMAKELGPKELRTRAQRAN